MGREKLPIACVNAEDMEPYPADYLYVSENVVTSSVSINHVITSLRVNYISPVLFGFSVEPKSD